MLSIRLTRVGKKKAPTYRIVVQEKSRDPWGKSVEIIGNYNPRTEDKKPVIKTERAKYWLDQGAQPSSTVHNLLVKAGILDAPKKRAARHDRKANGAAPVKEEKKVEEKPEEKPAEEKKKEE